ncbi:MAG: hypothetical protein ACREJ2_13430, partial [Planctomycetota bacterium]
TAQPQPQSQPPSASSSGAIAPGTGAASGTAPAAQNSPPPENGTQPQTGAPPEGATNSAPTPAAPIAAGSIDLAPVADTSIACYPAGVRSATAKDSEQSFNYGASQQIKIKRQENIGIFRFDFSKVPTDATITAAKMIVTMANGKAFNHIGVYTLHVPWNEGDGDEKHETAQDTGACFLGPMGPATRWRDWNDSDFSHAAAGNGGNADEVTRAKDLGNGKWEIDIEPQIIYAAIQDGQTLCLNDETGQWGDKYTNAYVYSREAGPGKAPVLQLTWAAGHAANRVSFDGALQTAPGPFPGSLILHLPQALEQPQENAETLPPTPAVGYTVAIDGKKLPQVEVPRPAFFHRDMLVTGLPVGKTVAVDLTASDGLGATVETKAQAVTGAAWTQTLAAQPPAPAGLDFPPVPFADFTLRVVDGLTLYNPLNGDLAPQQIRKIDAAPEDGRFANAVRGDIVGFQVLLTGKPNAAAVKNVKFRLSDFKNGDETLALDHVEFLREYFLKMEVEKQDDWVADALPPLEADGLSIPSQENLPDQKMAAAYVDVHVPLTAKPGLYRGNLIVTVNGQDTAVPMAIQVYDLALPNKLSFVVEMNAYGHAASKERFYADYRLFHANRLSLNVLGYGHTNAVEDHLLPLAGEGKTLHITDWSKYDDLYGPIFSGAAAKGLPRDGQPASHWYLPFHESWPVNLQATDPNKICWEGRVAPAKDKKGYEAWLDRCMLNDPLAPDHFSAEWRAGSRAVAHQFAEHFAEKGWTTTVMQVFSNHKNYMSGGSLSLWVMDEPEYGRDYRALNWLLSFYGKALAGTAMPVQLRADISRPAWMGARFDEALGLTDSSASIEVDHDLVSRRMIATGKPIWWYGGAGTSATDPAAMTALFIRKWGLGCDGGLPTWTTVGGPGQWDKPGDLRYILHDPKTGAPVASFRMKACLQGQQFIELLNQLAAKPGFNRWMVKDLVEKEFSVKIVTVSKNPDDPGYSTFQGLDFGAIEKLRNRVIATLLAN